VRSKKRNANKTYVVIKEDNSRMVSNYNDKKLGDSILSKNYDGTNSRNSQNLDNRKKWGLWEGETNGKINGNNLNKLY
jgi:hypothetical protein